MKRKGISPILASVLLLAVTISVVGIFSGWAPQVAQDIMDTTEENTNQSVSCANDAAVKIESGSYDGTADEVNLAVRNTGENNLNNLILAAFDSDGTILNQATISLNGGTLSSETITSVTSQPSYVRAFAQSCSGVTDRLDL